MTDLDKDALYWQLRTENDSFLKNQRWWWHHHLNGTLRSRRQREAMQLAVEGEEAAMELVRALGYQAHLTTHNAPFDLWVSDSQGRAARVEVKTSLYSRKHRRYEWDIRQDEVDIVICLAKNGRYWPYIIPIADIGQRRNLAIWSYCPGDYKGQWAIYLNAWQHLHQAITNSQPRCWQLSLLHQGG